MKNETVKTYPDIPRNIISPSDDFTLLDFYKEYYDCIYIILHPFVKITHPSDIDFERVWPTKPLWPTKEEIVKFTKKVSWAEVVKLSGFKDVNQLDIALRTMILGLNHKYENKADADKLRNFITENNMIMPGEGAFSELLIDDMLRAILWLGHEWIFVGDEFGHERNLQYIQDIIDNKLQADYHRRNWYTSKNEILYTTHWDSHFTMLCSDRKTIEKILEKYPFEGFYCKPDTEIYWSIHSKV